MPETIQTAHSAPPRWNLDTIFPGFDSPEYGAAKKKLGELAASSVAHMENVPLSPCCDCAPTPLARQKFERWLEEALSLEDEADILSRTLSSYCYAIYSTDTGNKRAMSEINAIDEIALPFATSDVLFLNALAAHESEVHALVASNQEIGKFSFYINDALFWQKKQMSAAEEDLAADLARSGSDAWGRLQEQLTSTVDCLWDEKTGERKTLVQLRALAYDKDAAIREKAFRKELETCASIGMPVAAALNGIKGTAITLNGRRNWTGLNSSSDGSSFALSPALEKSVCQGRISAKTLYALVSAMEESLPHWRRYLKAKAHLLGKRACSFPDLFAPIGDQFPAYTWDDVRKTVISNFSSFSPRMGEFARRAFESGWIDGESRSGKVSGAYCTDMPLVKETRVLCNFDGAFNSVTTVAHELGHAFHSDVVKDLPGLQQDYPMTLAETASIFAETVVFESELAKASPEAKLGLVEVHLQDGCQIIVDILSRFYFEQSVFADRAASELTAGDYCDKMTEAQKRTYGDGLEPSGYHPYMWLVKCHYYSSDLAFYNFPYAFGQLFGMALYARYRNEGSAFAKTYESLLLETGRMDAVSLTASAGFDIESKEFWKSGIDVFVSLIDEFEKLVAAKNFVARGETAVTYDIILAGVGGQGVLSIATIIARAAMIDGLVVRQSEVHGMSQRGGGVQAHMRISDTTISSDLIPSGAADMILAMEPLESLRYLSCLKPEGILVTAAEPFVNIPDYPDVETLYSSIRKLPRQRIVKAEALAKEAGNAKSVNMVLIGAASSSLPVSEKALAQSVSDTFAKKDPRLVDINMKALELGEKAC